MEGEQRTTVSWEGKAPLYPRPHRLWGLQQGFQTPLPPEPCWLQLLSLSPTQCAHPHRTPGRLPSRMPPSSHNGICVQPPATYPRQGAQRLGAGLQAEQMGLIKDLMSSSPGAAAQDELEPRLLTMKGLPVAPSSVLGLDLPDKGSC